MSDRVCNCGAPIPATVQLPARCSCGAVYGEGQLPKPNPRRRRALRCFTVCGHNHCGQWGEHQDKGRTITGCGLLLGVTGFSPCKTFDWIHAGNGCPAADPLFPPAFRGRVGFLAAAYQPIGGTETWHQTLIPRLDDVAGFVCASRGLAGGDLSRLGCPAGVGIESARELAAGCDVLVAWGVGHQLGDILPADRPRVVSVSHCDHRSAWTCNMMRDQAPWTDHAVYLCPTGIQTVPDGIPSTWIRNAPDPRRVEPTRSRSESRQALGVDDGDRLVVMAARLSPEKRIHHVAAAVELLGAPYRLVVAGAAGGYSASYADELRTHYGDRIKFVDPVDPPGDLFAAADLVAGASSYEGYGLTVAEAMAAGVPVISTPVGFLDEAPELARLVDIDAGPDRWAAAIADDFADPAAMHRRADRARAFMLNDHSVERFASEWSQLIDHVAPASRAAA